MACDVCGNEMAFGVCRNCDAEMERQEHERMMEKQAEEQQLEELFDAWRTIEMMMYKALGIK